MSVELLYVWIEEYKNIKNQGFNFSSKYKFNFIKKKSQLRLESLNISLFNDNDRVLDIITIIGKNGTGKSNLLEFVQKSYTTNLKKSILIFEKNGKICVYDKRCEIPSLSFELYCESCVNSIEFNNSNIIRDSLITENTHILFYSPIFDLKYTSNENKKIEYLKDISTMNLFNKKNRELYYDDLVKEADFLYNKTIKIEKEPVNLEIKILNDLDENPIKVFNLEYLEGLKQILSTKHEELKKSYGIYEAIQNTPVFNKNKEKIFKEKVKEYFKIKMNIHIYRGINNCSLGIKIKINELHEKYFRNKENFESDILSINDKFFDEKYYFHEIKNFYELINSISYDCFHFENEEVSIRIEHKDKKMVKKVIEVYENLIYLQPKGFKGRTKGRRVEIINEGLVVDNMTAEMTIPKFLDFEWTPKLSTGERAYLQLYSRIYGAIKKNGTRKNKDHILILIDEGELYFHPEWQREYIYKLNMFLKALSKNFNIETTYKIVLTSHSPFVVADLPKDNIILLGEEQGELQNTFGANIYSLFKNSFFLKSSLGEFAQNKIKETIDDLSGEASLSADRITAIKYIISSIGEPLIKDKLESMYLKKIGKAEKLRILEEKIHALQLEKEKLQSSGEDND